MLPFALVLVPVASVSVPRQHQLLVLEGEQPTLSPPFRLQDGWLGSPEIRLHAELGCFRADGSGFPEPP